MLRSLLFVVLLAAGPSLAQSPPPPLFEGVPSPPGETLVCPETPSSQGSTSGSGLRAWLDPETGRLTSTPTPEQAVTFEELVRKDVELRATSRPAPRSFRLSGGGRGVFQEGGFLTSLVLVRTESGDLHLGCRGHDPGDHPGSEVASPDIARPSEAREPVLR